MPRISLDATDHKLLSLLRENARTATAELARNLGLSRTTVQSRIERMERGGVVAGYTVKLADEVEAGMIRTYVLITLAPKQTQVIQTALRRIPAVRTLHSVSGPFDLLAILAASSIGELDTVIDRIGQLDGVERTMSAIVLSTRFER
ncbi:MAG: Lrp/AsnC family transcriptional regulator [Holophaga sp.]|nr:Lrp/AsnC family transcriptional regulator [Holophaga sp.]